MVTNINLTDKDSSYCINCNFREERKGLIGAALLDFKHRLVADPSIIKRNKGKFCQLNFTQAPATYEATKNAIRNKGQICDFNPWKNVC